jgi:hypothetical protein
VRNERDHVLLGLHCFISLSQLAPSPLSMSYPITILSWPCIPYVISYSLSYTQMLELVPRLCTSKQLALVPGHPEVALNQYVEPIRGVG